MKPAFFLLACVLVGTGGCRASSGDECLLNSDCETGLLCSAEGRCVTSSQVSRAMKEAADSGPTADSGGPPDIKDTPRADAPTPADLDAAEGHCAEPKGVFEAAAAPCPTPQATYEVTSIVIAQEGGLENLATAGNPLIAQDIEEGKLKLRLLVDGTLETGCPGDWAWTTTEEDRAADCTARYVGGFPMPIPLFGGIAVIQNAVFLPETGVLTGLLDEAEVLAVVSPALRDTADQLITQDVDTDDDGVPDMASAKLIIGLDGPGK